MKGLICINLIAIVGMFTFVSNPASAKLVINEIMKNPAVVFDNKGEWFELHNPTAGDMDIDGWTIKDKHYDIHVIKQRRSLDYPRWGISGAGHKW